MKTILHQKMPLNQNGYLSLSLEIIAKYHDIIMNVINQNNMDCVVITSPMELTAVTGETKIITIDCKEYSYNELNEIIEKAGMYDVLNK